MIRDLRPDRREASVYAIDFKKEYEAGVRGLILDIDNTLVPQDAPVTEKAAALVKEIQAAGIKVCLISNNNEARVRPFAEAVGSTFIAKASKPSRKAYRNSMAALGTEEKNTLFIGDQLFTDIWGANRAGVPNILVDPVDLSSDLPGIKLKRMLERAVLRKAGTKAEAGRKKHRKHGR